MTFKSRRFVTAFWALSFERDRPNVVAQIFCSEVERSLYNASQTCGVRYTFCFQPTVNVGGVAVVSVDVQQCRQRAPVSVVDTVKLRRRGQSNDDSVAPLSGYLSNYVTELTGCGNIDSPWRVQALPGQRINLTLVDFGVSSMTSSTSSSTPRDRSAADAVPAVCQACTVHFHPTLVSFA